jgi:uncharacterized membrane protein YfhO
VVVYDAAEDDVLLVHQNWDAGWELEETGETVPRDPAGFMRLPVRAGQGKLTHSYHPIWFELGLATSGVLALGVGAIAVLRGRRRTERDAAGAHPDERSHP